MSDPLLRIEGLTKVYSGAGVAAAHALDGISFEVMRGEFFTLLGPSGCGKTTTLQCIAGLEQPTQGRILMDGQTVYCSDTATLVPANRRDLGMVFQSYAIWPHMTVYENVAFPLVHGLRAVAKADIPGKVQEALARVKLGHLADRPAPLLSGGQQQRVALARALVHAPRLLLLDEPLSNLDAKLRDQMRTELRDLVKSLGITTIFVSHDQVEAMSMSDRVALMRDGKIVQIGAPREIYLRPTSAFTANFMGHSNMLAGRLVSPTQVDTELGPVQVGASGLALGTSVAVVVRPQSMRLMPDDASRPVNSFDAKVTEVTFVGAATEIELEVGSLKLRSDLDSFSEIRLGDRTRVELIAERLAVVPADDCVR